MKKSIIILAGKEDTGKSSTLNIVWHKLRLSYPSASIHEEINDGDILATITIGEVKIGIESQGDPDSRIFKTLEQLMGSTHSKLKSCDIIICASRTRGSVKNLIINLSDAYGYHRLWNGAPITSIHNVMTKNELCADYILAEVQQLITGKL